MNGEDVGGLARLGVDHSPDAATVAVVAPVFTHDVEVALGEVAHGALHPRLNEELVVLTGHLLHLDGQAREHPRLLYGVQIFHADATVGGVEVGCVEHVIAQMSHHQLTLEVAMKGFGEKQVFSNFIHVAC